MTKTPLKIPGAYILKPDTFTDSRGVFRRHFDAEKLGFPVVQANVSENPKWGTLRGFHMQQEPHGERKLLSCLRGSIQDIVVDLRPDSPTFGQWEAYYLDSDTRQSLHIPAGCANAFLTLAPNVLVHYYCSHPYTPDAERGIRWDDPAFNFEWDEKPLHLSAKDAAWSDWK